MGWYAKALLAAALVTVAIWPGALRAQERSLAGLLTEDLPPYSYIEDGKITGAAVEVVREMMRRTGSGAPVRVHSWTMAYRMAMSRDKYGIFAITRTPEREKYFKWVGPIINDRLALFAAAENPMKIDSLEDAKKARRLGVYKDDVAEKILLQAGFKNLDSVQSSRQNVLKLVAGRIDLWAENVTVAREIAREEGLEDRIRPVYMAQQQTLFLAFNISVDDALVKAWQIALDEMKADGQFGLIMTKYGLEER